MTTSINIKIRRRRRLDNIKMRRGRKLLNIIGPPELIADAMHRLDQGRVLRIGLDLLTQVSQVKVNGAVKAIIVQAVDALHQFLAAKCPARRGGKRFQEFELPGGETDWFPREPDLVRLQVDDQVASMQRCWTFC